MDIESVEEATSCLQKVTDNIQELLESEDGIATIMNEHRSYLANPTIQIYTKLLSKHSMTNIEELEKIMKKQAFFFGDRGKCSNAVIINCALWVVFSKLGSVFEKKGFQVLTFK